LAEVAPPGVGVATGWDVPAEALLTVGS
jgi:hypothetical protein